MNDPWISDQPFSVMKVKWICFHCFTLYDVGTNECSDIELQKHDICALCYQSLLTMSDEEFRERFIRLEKRGAILRMLQIGKALYSGKW